MEITLNMIDALIAKSSVVLVNGEVAIPNVRMREYSIYYIDFSTEKDFFRTLNDDEHNHISITNEDTITVTNNNRSFTIQFLVAANVNKLLGV